VAAVLALVVAPAEAIQGQPQRLMYVHVPAAWTAFLAFGVVALASCADLLRPSARSAAVALGSAELGVAMTGLTLAEGSVWGHSAWGVWWTWDPRLVTTALLFVLGVVYLALRALPGEPARTVRRADLAGLAFAGLVPLVHGSVLWWRTLHQPPTLLRPDLSPPIAPLMLVALLTSLVAFLCGGAWYVQHRVLQLMAGPREDARTVAARAPLAEDQAAASLGASAGSVDHAAPARAVRL
jgi:heme exporter protein C